MYILNSKFTWLPYFIENTTNHLKINLNSKVINIVIFITIVLILLINNIFPNIIYVHIIF